MYVPLNPPSNHVDGLEIFVTSLNLERVCATPVSHFEKELKLGSNLGAPPGCSFGLFDFVDLLHDPQETEKTESVKKQGNILSEFVITHFSCPVVYSQPSVCEASHPVSPIH